jgi:preprotein translocase subunit SecD
MSRLTDTLLGLSAGPTRAPNTYSLGQYLGILFVIVLGAIYAAPNLFPPDYALQIRAEAADAKMTPDIVDKATKALEAANIRIKGTHVDAKNALLRLYANDDQLRGSEVVQKALQNGDGSASQYVVALNLASSTPAWMQALGGKPMSYGLDLSGGVHFLLEVDMPKAINDRMKSEEDNIRKILRDGRLRYVPSNDMVDGTKVNIAFYDEATRDQAKQAIEQQYRDFQILQRDLGGKPALLMTMKDVKIKEIETYAISQNLQSLRNRVNELGVSEPLVQSLGRSRIVVDLPGVQDSAEAKRILNKFANLEFRLVAKQDARPSETESYPYEGRNVVVERRNIVTGDRVTNATQDFDPQNNLPQVSITLDGTGGERMNDATKGNVGNQMAILYKELKPRSRTVVGEDGKETVENFSVEEKRLINVATIRSALGYRFRITGVGLGEARDLALLLKAGALAAPMYIVEERTVGASLGEDNIRAGLHAALGGYVLVLLCMVIYYKAFGMIANIALAVNVILLVALMSVLGATLTMPGIAGIVLTMGMAVDANVLIFSRVREEARDRPPQAAITAGFDRAFTTIVDSNITHLLVALVLLAFGTGPIKGFAVVLTLGIITSMFTAITVTRAMVNLAFGNRNLKKLYV